MNPNLIIETITARMTAHMQGTLMSPVVLIGPPGVGKTQTVEAIAKRMDIGFTHIHGPTMLAEDFGIPIPLKDGSMRFAVPQDKFPFEGDDQWPEFGIINFDELAAMGNDQQKIVANLMQQRELHGRKIKAGWMFIASGNRQEDRAGANRILSHLNDRYITIAYEMKTDDWIEWAYTIGGVAAEVIAFLQWRSDLLAPTFDPNIEKNATPRGWAERVSPALASTPKAALFEVIKGSVGEGPAVEFMAFNETYLQLPDPDLIFAKPGTYPVPDEAHILYALIGALIARVKPDTFPALVEYGVRMPPEFMVMMMRNVITAHPQLTQTDTFTKWAGTAGARALFSR
jgi:DNA polymerase III delta prime subunit